MASTCQVSILAITFVPILSIDFMKKIAIENEDFDFSILGISDSKEYLEDYCDNLVNVW